MKRTRVLLIGCALLSAGCSDRDRPAPDVEVAEASNVVTEVEAKAPPITNGVVRSEAADLDEEFAGYIELLDRMKSVERQAEETLLTGDTLSFDYQAHSVSMDGNVLVTDDQGQLGTDHLSGRFTASNEVEFIEARGHVEIESGARAAHADQATYDYREGAVQLDGQAVVSEGGNRLSAERIRFWIRDDRRLICEPNALLVIQGRSDTAIGEMPKGMGETEIRANQMIYDESRSRVDLIGKVRLRNEQVAMNCGEVYLFMKDDNKIDWIEAVSEVIIHSEDRKALADRATYDADEGKFTLEGHPMVMQGDNIMTGDRIMFWHETRGMVCEPNARVLLYLDEETKAKFLRDLND